MRGTGGKIRRFCVDDVQIRRIRNESKDISHTAYTSLCFLSSVFILQPFAVRTCGQTFAATASTDANDYSAPISNLSGAAQWISEVRRDYVLPDSIVDFDGSLYGSLSRAGFWQGKNETMHFFFDFNDFTFGIDVLHSPTAANDISGILAERNTSLPVTDYAAWKAEKSFSPGFLTRTDGNRSAIYTIDNGRVESVKVISGSCRVHITLNSHPEGKTTAEAAEEFLTSPATAGFAALFSEDDTVFRAAVDKINAGLAGR